VGGLSFGEVIAVLSSKKGENSMSITDSIVNGKKVFEVYVGGKDLRGRRFQKRKRGIETLRQAKDIEFEFERELAKLREEGYAYYWDEWLEIALDRMKHERTNSTILNYRSYLGKWATPNWIKREIRSITREDVYSVVYEKFDAKLSPNARRTLLKQIRRIFQMAVEEGFLDRNPTAGIRVNVPEVEQDVLTNEEVKTFLQAAKDTNHRFYPIWVMALGTGMRSGELFALNWSDIDLDAKLISVTKQWTNKDGIKPTKTKRCRVVPISDELVVFLKEEKLRSRTEGVLPKHPEWENGEQAQVTREFCMAVGITSVKFHDLRATFITTLLARGVPLAVVMSIVGHSQIKTTNGYLRKAGVEVQGWTNKLGYSVPGDAAGTLLQLVK
jgi:integrase